jgi:hypothetical protein
MELVSMRTADGALAMMMFQDSRKYKTMAYFQRFQPLLGVIMNWKMITDSNEAHWKTEFTLCSMYRQYCSMLVQAVLRVGI